MPGVVAPQRAFCDVIHFRTGSEPPQPQLPTQRQRHEMAADAVVGAADEAARTQIRARSAPAPRASFSSSSTPWLRRR
jgi:hypothetical protein